MQSGRCDLECDKGNRVKMIEVIPAITSSQAKTGSDAETSEGKVELLAAAADFLPTGC